MASSPPDGAVPPPPDGATDVPATITPPSGSVEGTNAEAPDLGANKSWAAGSQDANAAAWAAYQQQYAYQYAGGEWSAYHAAWATEYARHNESMAAAAAAPSPEQLAHVAAKIAEQLATVENENNTKNAKQPKSGDAETVRGHRFPLMPKAIKCRAERQGMLPSINTLTPSTNASEGVGLVVAGVATR